MPGQMLPIIQAGAFELFVVQLEAERFDQMQRRSRGRAQPRHVPGVRRNLRLDENDVHGRASNGAMECFPP